MNTGDTRIQAVFIVLLSLLLYVNTLPNGFVYDDWGLIAGNAWITSFKSIPEIFFSHHGGFIPGQEGNYYRPLINLIYLLTFKAFGLEPWGFHLVNIIFHAAAALFVFLIARGLVNNSNVPFMAGLLFAAHPVHTEAVAWPSALSELSFSLFFLLSFYFYIKGREKGPVKYCAASLAAFFLSMLSKESALSIPLLLFAYDFSFNGSPFKRKNIFRYLPYLVVMGVYFLLRLNVIPSFIAGDSGFGPGDLLINFFPLFKSYCAKLVFPLDLNLFYGAKPIEGLSSPAWTVSVFVFLAFILAGFFLFKRAGRAAFFSLFLFLIPLLPAFYIKGISGGAVFAERYLYLPSFGFVLLVSIGIDRLKAMKNATAAGAVFLTLLCAYSALAFDRNRTWKDEFTIWADTVEKSPDIAIPHMFLGDALLERGETGDAIRHYARALELEPDSATAHNNLGYALTLKNFYDEAIAHFEAALRIDPRSAEALNNLGLAYKNKGDLDKAIESFRAALALRPDVAGLHENLANTYLLKGLPDLAQEEFRKAESLKSTLPD